MARHNKASFNTLTLRKRDFVRTRNFSPPHSSTQCKTQDANSVTLSAQVFPLGSKVKKDSGTVHRIHIRNGIGLPKHLVLYPRGLIPRDKRGADTIPRSPVCLVGVIPHQQIILVTVAETRRVEPGVDAYVAIAYIVAVRFLQWAR